MSPALSDVLTDAARRAAAWGKRTKPTASRWRYRRCSATVWRGTKMADGCWVYRGGGGGGMETPARLSLPHLRYLSHIRRRR